MCKPLDNESCQTYERLYFIQPLNPYFQKPPEPEKKALDKELEKKEVIEVRAPITGPQLIRPPFDNPLVTLNARIADSLKELVQKTEQKVATVDDGYDIL